MEKSSIFATNHNRREIMTTYSDIQCLLQLAAALSVLSTDRVMSTVRISLEMREIVKKTHGVAWVELSGKELGAAKAALKTKLEKQGPWSLCEEELGLIASMLWDNRPRTEAFLRKALRKYKPVQQRREALQKIKGLVEKSGPMEEFFRTQFVSKLAAAIAAIPEEKKEKKDDKQSKA